MLILAFPASLAMAGELTVTGIIEMADPPRMRRQARQYTPGPQEAGPSPRPLPVVYLRNETTPRLLKDDPGTADMIQKDLQFMPALLPIQVGTTVRFPNMDNTFHNVFSYSPAKTFDLGRYRRDEEPPTRVFNQPGVIQLFCEVHDHMRATILVLDTPFFASVNEEGGFSIANVPPGTYQLVIWHSPRNQISREIVIPEGKDSIHLDLTQKRP